LGIRWAPQNTPVFPQRGSAGIPVAQARVRAQDRCVTERVRTILVGVDGSARASEALAFAARLAQATGARLVAASVYASRPPWGRLGSGERALAVAREACAAAGAHCEPRFIPAPSPAAGLEQLARAEGADLVVIGSRHRGRLGEALPGEVGHGLLRSPSRPVVFVAQGEPARPLRHVGVLPDGERRRTLALGERLAAATHADLRVYDGTGAAEAVAGGRLDALVVPDWPHGLMGRLRRGGRPARRPAGRCVLVVAPPRVEAEAVP
jgi:nucleotide-binding universal stress UspA family protein